MAHIDTVQRLTPPSGGRLLSADTTADSQAAVHVRAICKAIKAKTPADLRAVSSLHSVASYPNTLEWDAVQPLDSLPKIWRPLRRAGRYALVAMGGDGSCLVAEIVHPGAPLEIGAQILVHPHPLHLPLATRVCLDETCFSFQAGDSAEGAAITIGPDPGLHTSDLSALSSPASAPPPRQQEKILSILDQEIISWGELLSALSVSARGWPAPLCRNVLPDKTIGAEISKVLKAIGICALERFVPGSPNELLISIAAPDRPSPLHNEDGQAWSVFINLRNEVVPASMVTARLRPPA